MEPTLISASFVLAAVLFSIGLAGILVRRNILMILICVEIMLNATGIAFIAAGSMWNQPDGQIMFIAIVTLGAAEVAIGLGLTLLLFRKFNSVDVDNLKQMRG